ncbi:MAG: phosphotransferase [Atopobiaceae bacterium]|nr:phosphotransferase [Atopobiaceae bacterium]
MGTRAIILAAGVGKRMAPLSYELPKALLTVRGEVLIERLIRQLREAGVEDVTVVTGYMKEAFFYLEDLLGVQIAVNPNYVWHGNAASLLTVSGLLPGSFICASDQYFEDNPFICDLEGSSCCCVSDSPERQGWRVSVSRGGFISSLRRGVGDSPRVRTPLFLSEEDGAAFAGALVRESAQTGFADLNWDDILSRHLGELRIKARSLRVGSVHEFKSFEDLISFDQAFVDNVDSSILDNICSVLGCDRHAISGIEPISQGLTNLSFKFSVDGKSYVYRHPGKGTDEIINRAAEAHALGIAKHLGLDETFIYEDPVSGWKISRFIEDCIPFDYRNTDHVARGLSLVRKLHDSGETSPWSFDFWDEAVKIERILRKMSYPLPRDFGSVFERTQRVAGHMAAEQAPTCLCHNDFYGPNFLVHDDDMWLIDWEYAAMGDPACDLGNFVAQGSGYTVEETVSILPLYYGREPSAEEVRHCLGAVGVVGYYWYVWAIFKEAQGNPVGEWLYIWYKAARDYCAAALKLYEPAGGTDA